ncbi:MAG: hypothetical protein J6C96_01505 [Oscillospiraceae bacterium]|nr:hypothetical protein [Oscillospiraceae bacterium]
MAQNNMKASAADIAVNTAIIILAAVIAVLLGIYFIKPVLPDKSSASESPHVIGSNTAPIETEAPVTVTTQEAVSQTETVTVTEITTDINSSPDFFYNSEFFDDVFFIGDSISTGLVNYEFLKPENVFAQAGLTPSSVMTTDINGISVYDAAAKAGKSYICIMLGTNGLSYLESDYMSEKMTEFIDELQRVCPNSRVVLVSIPPVTKLHEDEKPEKLDKITEYNSHIQKIAEDKELLFADIFSLLRDETGYLGEHYAETDGLHLKIYAYPVILSTLQTVITGETPVPPETSAVSESSAASDASESEAAATTVGSTNT